MPRQTVTIGSQANWETGEFSGTNALDPAGSLTLGVDTTRVAELVDDGALAVYCRCYEGSGSTAANVGLAGNAALASHAWAERDDGRSWLYGGTATVTAHASMRIADGAGKYKNGSGGIRIKLSSLAAQTLITRTNSFTLGINGSYKPYITWRYSADKTATSNDALEAGKEYTISFTSSQGTTMLYVNGTLKAQMSYNNPAETPNANIVFRCLGYWTDFYFLGDGSNGQIFDRQATTGWWKKTIDLGEVMKLQHLYVNCAKVENEHSISARVSFGSTEDEIAFEQNENSILWAITDGESWNEPPETKLKCGQYVEIKIQLGAMDWSRDLPLVYNLEAEFMPLAAGLLPDIDLEEEAPTYEFLGEDMEVTSPEDLESALAAIRELQAVIIEGRTSASSGYGGGGLSLDAIRAAARRAQEELDALAAQVARLSVLSALPGYSDEQTRYANWLVNQDPTYARDVMMGLIFTNQTAIFALQEGLQTHIEGVYADGVHSLNDVDVGMPAVIAAAVSAHANLTTGTHGLTEEADGDFAGEAFVNQTMLTHMGSATAHDLDGVGSLYNHRIATTAIHGVGASTVASVGNIATHNASSNVHGLAAGVYVAGASSANQNIQSALSTHAGLQGNVHGVGVGDEIAPKTWVSTQVSNHASVTQYIHGVGTNYVAKSASSTKTTETLISDHAGASDPHGDRAFATSAVSTHAGLSTGVHGAGGSTLATQAYAVSAAGSAIATHVGLCVNFAES